MELYNKFCPFWILFFQPSLSYFHILNNIENDLWIWSSLYLNSCNGEFPDAKFSSTFFVWDPFLPTNRSFLDTFFIIYYLCASKSIRYQGFYMFLESPECMDLDIFLVFPGFLQAMNFYSLFRLVFLH